MKLLVKLMVIFATIYALAGIMKSVRVNPAFTFLATALIGLFGIAGDRLLLPKMGRATAIIGDALLCGLMLFGASQAVSGRDSRVTLPYIGLVSAALGGFEGLFHEWIYDRDAHEEPRGGLVH
ncbi:uncharacterized protein DUF2512 [Tumebacillus sp. BK434]|uniref:DUF2512 family protein n=1 Tax=Tumebacillus sp. BK434 TaxID=2512169 RepID=UPI001046BACA|nr:DUF2512 family protein [Tumebacillus sp. BK434]TCP54554.1 uncharacterized protein DUF2512 [Tumebacillus sp. BK434]